MRNITLLIICALPVAASVFTAGKWFSDYMIMPKWYGMIIMLALSITILCTLRIAGMCKGLSSEKLWTQMEKAVMTVCALQALFMISQHYGIIPPYGMYTTGSFENAAGFASCMALSMPLALRRLTETGYKGKCIIITYILLCVTAVVCSGSRTGILCIIVSGCIMLCRMLSIKYAAIIPVAIIAAAISAVAIKTDSTNGRWFILQRTAELIKRHPITGDGTGTFDREYMNIQAEYFKNNPDCEYSMLADNIHHPLNELMLVAVDFGIIGFAILAAISLFTVCHARKNTNRLTHTGLHILAVILLFSMFSYPFLYPFTWIMLAAAIFCIFEKGIRINRYAILFITPLAVAGATYIIFKAKTDRQLQRILETAEYRPARKCVPMYEAYYNEKRNDYSYLYSLAVMQFDAGLYRRALKTAMECSKILADYDLCLLLGDINRELRNFSDATHWYKQAHFMCPSRITPLYETYMIYRQTENTTERRRMADIILNKPVKIKSETVNQMLDEIRGYEN
ncbi:O-antigen ligase family protein [Xylanibacter muris]|uniref:O-antigen ligase family protein n=1 Tax=Xylanibacter muris TaxID=2736290 RepID=A0ABX2APT0_9BACT|nr:O-antigen ligase family protein [Xylanibacter muris]NPD93263.1 O-antigen ligase family protein [Xylanibacter muris]